MRAASSRNARFCSAVNLRRLPGSTAWTLINAAAVIVDSFEKVSGPNGGYITMLTKRQAALSALWTPVGFTELQHDFAQFEFMKRIGQQCPEAVNGAETYHGSNVGGSAWTQHRFVRYPGVLPGGGNEVIFHRIDKRQDPKCETRFYFSTRQYAAVKGNPEVRKARVLWPPLKWRGAPRAPDIQGFSAPLALSRGSPCPRPAGRHPAPSCHRCPDG